MPPVINHQDQNELVPTGEYPFATFPFEDFNPVQSRVHEIYDKDINCLIAAATSSGKTVCSELFLAHEVRERGGKGMYLAPLRALAQEKIDDWQDKSHHFSDLNLSICTGDYRLTPQRKKELEQSDLIMMTSEMLNSRCRNFFSENNNWIEQIGTLVIDESHLLTVPGRGDHLEAGLMKFCAINPNARIIMLSATMPNCKEIAEWVSYTLTKRETHMIESVYRPCPLTLHYEEYSDNMFKYDAKEREKVRAAMMIIEDYPEDKFIAFVHTKRTGHLMVKELKRAGIKCEFHNADLDLKNRTRIAEEFKSDSGLRVVVATSTLAWGCYSHDGRLTTPNGKLINVVDVEEGTELLCPVNNGYQSKKVVRAESFSTDTGYFVKVESGEEMKVSQDHIFFAASQRKSPDWVEVKNLSKGDYLARPSNTGIWKDLVPIDDKWYLMGYTFGDGCLTDVGAHADGSQKAVLDICLGLYDFNCEYIKNMMEENFDLNLKYRIDDDNIYHLQTKKKSVVDQFLSLLPLGRKNGNNDIPNQIYDNQIYIRSFVSGLFDADGGVEYHGNQNWSVGLTNISKKVIESVKEILIGFGIVCSFGKKKMKDSIINGRKQKAVREYSYRLRIFGYQNLMNFKKFIGFRNLDKKSKLDSVLDSNFNYEKDIIPARDLISNHLLANKMFSKDFREITGSDLYNSLNIQDCRRETLQKLLDNTSVKSELNNLLDKPIRWSRISEINKCEGGEFREIEVEDPHAYIGNGVISHNCNFPARRVVIVGVHRGLSLVETYDISQEVGRAGRPKFDKSGDAYILLPESDFQEQKTRLETPQEIVSQMLDDCGGHNKILAFHLVSEIHHGGIKTREDVHDWFARSLAAFQNQELKDEIVDGVIELLLKCRAIREEDGVLLCNAVGKIASLFYFSPFDVARLRRNFGVVFDDGLENNDLAVSFALGNTDTNGTMIVSRAEREEMATYQGMLKRTLNSELHEPSVKAGFAYYQLLSGKVTEPMASIARNFQMDFQRVVQVLNGIDSMSTKWKKGQYFKKLSLRILYGVRAELVYLCQIPNIGRVRADKLWNAGLKNAEDVYKNAETAKRVLNMKEETANKVLEDAKKVALAKNDFEF